MNGHQHAAAGNVKAVSRSLPRAGELPDLSVFNRSEGSVRKNACAYLLELKSKLQLNCCLCFLVMFKYIRVISVNVN